MKVLPFIISKPENTTLIVQEDRSDNFYSKLHQHEEIQLSCILKGEGTFYIGDCIGHFSAGDVFAIGQHLPHVFSNEESEREGTGAGVHMISLFFTPETYGKEFFEHPEFESFRPFFDSVKMGVQLKSNLDLVRKKMKGMIQQDSFSRFLSFIELMQLLGQGELNVLSTFVHKKRFGEEEGSRMRDIMEFTLENYHRELSAGKVAQIANMTPNAFCRYFKQRTNKTYMKFVQELRIGRACKLLSQNGDMRVCEIAYESGFNNLTNFNRKFKQEKGRTPSEFRKGL